MRREERGGGNVGDMKDIRRPEQTTGKKIRRSRRMAQKCLKGNTINDQSDHADEMRCDNSFRYDVVCFTICFVLFYFFHILTFGEHAF